MKPYLIYCLILLANIPSALAQGSRTKQPNIIIVMADDLDSRQLSCYGGKNIRTRYIDQLAEQGLKFNNIYASHATCVPTRASLFTGLYPMRHGSFQNHKPVFPGIKSIAHYLTDQGYKVGLTGKDHSTRPTSSFPFDIVGGFQKDCIASEDEYDLDGVRKYITKDDKPFCLFIMSINPHKPWDLGDPSEFDPEKIILPPNMVDTRQTRVEYCKYLAEIRRLDNQVGDVIKMLKQTRKQDNTILMFLGEQGPQFPGGKWTCWDYGQKSSMIIRWPQQLSERSTTSAFVQYEDITPTLIDIAGGKPIAELDGKSFLPVIKNQSRSIRNYVYGIYNNIPEGPSYPSRSVRDKQFKLILNLSPQNTYSIKWYNSPGDVWSTWQEKAKNNQQAKFLVDRVSKRPTVEFYDMINDPYELSNLADDPKYKRQIASHQLILKQWMNQQQDKGAQVDRVYNRK